MLARFFHAWERRLATVTKDRVVRPFEWGLDWISENGHPAWTPAATLLEWVAATMADTEAFFHTVPATDAVLTPSIPSRWGETGTLTFSSGYQTPDESNNTVYARYFQARQTGGAPRRAVVVLPQWNADPGGHAGLCRLLAYAGMSALRLSMPYHDERMPPYLHRADFIVSSNIARTVQVCRQAVLDARRAAQWLAEQGYERIGILGTSLGSCLALLTTAHEPLIRAEALNHISPYFADVVWEGLSTAHVRAGLEGHIDLDLLRRLWMPISPRAYLDRLREKKTLLVYARYDLTFPVGLSRALVDQFHARGIPHDVAVLPCGHYSTGQAPFKFLDGLLLTRFLRRSLSIPRGRRTNSRPGPSNV